MVAYTHKGPKIKISKATKEWDKTKQRQSIYIYIHKYLCNDKTVINLQV